MIIVRLKGGLGNQMFQYAAGKTLALLLEKELIVDTVFLSYYPKSGLYTERKFDLGFFNIDSRILNQNNLFLKYFTNFIVYKLYNTIYEIFFRAKKIDNLLPKTLLSIKKYPNRNYLLEGDFQHIYYLPEFRTNLLSDFTLKRNFSELAVTYIEKIKTTNSVSIHIRRSDYLLPKNNSIYQLCSVEYYNGAFNYILNKVDQPIFFVFSDDIAWAKHNIKREGFLFYYISDKSISSSEDIILMSLCKHNIIANSTFSWWGAWLNASAGKIVVAPKRWFTSYRYRLREASKPRT